MVELGFIKPEEPNKPGEHNPNRFLEGVGLTSLTPPPPGHPGAPELVPLIPGARIGAQHLLETVAASPAEQEALRKGNETATNVETVLGNTKDPERGNKALGLLDIAMGRELRINSVNPYAAQAIQTYSETANNRLRSDGAFDDPALTGAHKADVVAHLDDANQLDSVVGSTAKSIADQVKGGDPAAALKSYDLAYGASYRRHSNDSQFVVSFMTGLNAELKRLKVMSVLDKQAISEGN